MRRGSAGAVLPAGARGGFLYQGQINQKYSARFHMPATYYSQLLTVAHGGSAKDAGLDGNLVRAAKLEAIAAKN